MTLLFRRSAARVPAALVTLLPTATMTNSLTLLLALASALECKSTVEMREQR